MCILYRYTHVSFLHWWRWKLKPQAHNLPLNFTPSSLCQLHSLVREMLLSSPFLKNIQHKEIEFKVIHTLKRLMPAQTRHNHFESAGSEGKVTGRIGLYPTPLFLQSTLNGLSPTQHLEIF